MRPNFGVKETFRSDSMIKLLILFTLLLTSNLSAQEYLQGYSFGNRVATRDYQFDDRFFIVRYEYNPFGITSVPSTMGESQAHYSANITVSEIVNGRAVELSKHGGVYTERGCFEDDPKTLVLNALKGQ
jgi:hypothetical protein